MMIPRMAFNGKRLAAILLIGAASLLAQESGEAGKGEDSLSVWKWANFLILAGGLGYLIGKSAPGMFRNRTSEIQKRRMVFNSELRCSDLSAFHRRN